MAHNQDYKCSTFKGPMWALHSSLLAERFFLASLLACTKSFTSLVFCVVGDTLGDFISRSAKIARRARCSDCDRRPANKFAKCARSRDFLQSFLRIASKANPSGWTILLHDFSKLPHRRDRRKIRQVCPHQSVAKSLAIFAGDQIRRDQRIKSPGVSLTLES